VRACGVRFDVNCSMHFAELPLVERAATVKAAGFGGVEWSRVFEDEAGDAVRVTCRTQVGGWGAYRVAPERHVLKVKRVEKAPRSVVSCRAERTTLLAGTAWTPSGCR
jgi:hypothetical protein